MPNLSVVLPAHNEEDTVESVAKEVSGSSSARGSMQRSSWSTTGAPTGRERSRASWLRACLTYDW